MEPTIGYEPSNPGRVWVNTHLLVKSRPKTVAIFILFYLFIYFFFFPFLNGPIHDINGINEKLINLTKKKKVYWKRGGLLPGGNYSDEERHKSRFLQAHH